MLKKIEHKWQELYFSIKIETNYAEVSTSAFLS